MKTPFLETRAANRLDEFARAGLTRRTQTVVCESPLHFASNDYLALSSHPEVVRAGTTPAGLSRIGASASRLVSGTFTEHLLLEQEVAACCGKPAALVVGSGYHANVAVLQGILTRKDVVFADRFVHASILDGIRLAGAELIRFAHNDAADLRKRIVEYRQHGEDSDFFIVTESLFSINGDYAPLAELVQVANEFEAVLIVDEAHAFGVFGERGGGLVQASGLTEDVAILTGSFAKATGTFGGFVACSAVVRELLVHQGRACIYSTALPLNVVCATRRSMELLDSGEVDRQRLFTLVQFFIQELQERLSYSPGASSFIVPLYCQGNERVNFLTNKLREAGIFAYPMRRPTVPPGEECIRFSLTLHHSEQHILKVLEILSTHRSLINEAA